MYNLLLTLLVCLFCGSIIILEDNNSSLIVTGLFVVLMLQNIYYLNFKGGNNFSCYKVYFVFSFIFMAFTPYLHFTQSKFFWGATPVGEYEYIITICTLLCFNFVFGFSYNYGLTLNNSKEHHYNNFESYSLNNKYIIYIIIIVFTVTIYHINKNSGNLLALFFRVKSDTSGIEWNSSNQPLLLIIGRITMFLPFFGLLLTSKYSNNTYIKLILFLCLLICAFPLVISRYAVAAIYIPILFFFYPNLLNGRKMQYALIFSICTIFPFLEQFRRYEIGQTIKWLPSVDFFYQPHFDTFQNLMLSISTGFITYGYQLLGSILFFIPRIIWSSKPIGSGAQLAENANYFFTNVSMPLVGELYINFGVLGIFVCPILLGIGLRKLDTKFWNFHNKNSDYDVLYIYLLGFLTFLLRGDLLSSWAYFCSGAFSYIIMSYIRRIKLK